MTETIKQLSYNAIPALIKENDQQESIIVQILQFIPKKDKFYIIISDGNYTIKALPKDKDLLDPSNLFVIFQDGDVNSIIAIKRHMTGKNNVVGIIEYEKLFNYKSQIGTPIEFDANGNNPENVQIFNLQKSMINMKIQATQKQNKKPNQAISNMKTAQTLKKNVPPPPSNKPINGKLSDFETIKGLYIGMSRWTIVCRIVKIDYSQFISKKTGKQTKMLSIQLMDRTGMKISGTFFGEAAVSFKDTLVKDRVYQISQGQIRQQNYNNTKNQKRSPYKLVFTNLSQFEEVSDTNSIARNQDAAITLGDCVQKRILGQQFDVICILIKIEQTVEVKKQDGILKKTNLLVADPIKNITLFAVLWNQNIIPDASLMGKTVILSQFKLSEYKNSLTLGSIYKSSIIPVTDHLYQQYETKAMNEYQDYQKLQQIKSSGMDIQHTLCTSFKELEQKLQNLNNEEFIRGDYNVYINKFGLKKWHYDGCPHCDKAAQKLSNCNHCQKYVQNTVGHFIMPIQVCDSTGSLWTTAYDELAKKIFEVADQHGMIQHLSKLDANQLKQQTQGYLYQQYLLRITSRKDKQGRIKHNVSKIHERDYANQTAKNIELINKLSLF